MTESARESEGERKGQGVVLFILLDYIDLEFCQFILFLPMAALASSGGVTFVTDEAFLARAAATEGGATLSGNSGGPNPLTESVVLKHARSELQKMGIDESIPDEVLKSFVREVKVKTPPSPQASARPDEETAPFDSGPPTPGFTDAAIMNEPVFFSGRMAYLPDSPSALCFDASRGLFRPPRTPPRAIAGELFHSPERDVGDSFSNQLLFPNDYDDVFDDALGNAPEEESSIAQSLLRPTEGAVERSAMIENMDRQIEQFVSSNARTPSATVGYGPYKFNTVESKKMQKLPGDKPKRVQPNRSKNTPVTTKRGAAKKKSIIKSGAKRVPFRRVALREPVLAAANSTKGNSTSGQRGVPRPRQSNVPLEEKERQRQRYISLTNRRFLSSVDTGETSLATGRKTPRAVTPGRFIGYQTPASARRSTPRPATSSGVRNRKTAMSTPRRKKKYSGPLKLKKTDPVKMFARHQKAWKSTSMPKQKNDRTRLQIRAKMLKTRILNEDAGKRGFGRPSRSIDKWRK